MISNKFKVGWRYKVDGHSLVCDGVVEITDINDYGRISYKVIEGMEDDGPDKSFDEGSGFSNKLSLIKNKKKGFLL